MAVGEGEMAYQGEILNACGIVNVDLKDAEVVAVSGDGPNLCGHLLFYTASSGGLYFHVAGLRAYPRFMNQNGFENT